MLLLCKALTPNEKMAALQAAEMYGDELHAASGNRDFLTGKGNEHLPMGRQAVLQDDPHWDPNCSTGDWKHKYFLLL